MDSTILYLVLVTDFSKLTYHRTLLDSHRMERLCKDPLLNAPRKIKGRDERVARSDVKFRYANIDNILSRSLFCYEDR